MRPRILAMAGAAAFAHGRADLSRRHDGPADRTFGDDDRRRHGTIPIGTIPDPAACAEGLTLDDGVLTVATGEPAFPPYVIDDAPETGEGFEAAVAYAVAEQLGFAPEDVVWTRTLFDAAIAPGPKDFDFNIQQYSITEDRLDVVSFSVPYYTSTQAIVATADSPAVDAATLPDLQALPARRGSRHHQPGPCRGRFIQPDEDVQVFNTNADGGAGTFDATGRRPRRRPADGAVPRCSRDRGRSRRRAVPTR